MRENTCRNAPQSSDGIKFSGPGLGNLRVQNMTKPLLTMMITQEQPQLRGVRHGSRDGQRLGQDKCWETPAMKLLKENLKWGACTANRNAAGKC